MTCADCAHSKMQVSLRHGILICTLDAPSWVRFPFLIPMPFYIALGYVDTGLANLCTKFSRSAQVLP